MYGTTPLLINFDQIRVVPSPPSPPGDKAAPRRTPPPSEGPKGLEHRAPSQAVPVAERLLQPEQPDPPGPKL